MTGTSLKGWGDHDQGKLLFLGVAAAALYNLRLWKHDAALMRKKAGAPPVPPPDSWPHQPLVSILVAAWNEARLIDAHIYSFQNLRYRCRELILCAGGSDNTYALAAKWAGEDIHVIEQHPGEGKQRALRRSLEAARGEVIFLTDADCRLNNDSFERTIYPVISGKERACTGGSQPYPELMGNPFVVAQAASPIYSSFHRPAHTPGLLGRNFAIERHSLEMSQGLDAPAPTGTDYVLAKMLHRAGIAIRQIPESLVETEYPTAPRAYIRQKRRWLRNVALYGRRYGANAEVRASLATSSVGLGMLLLPFSSLILGKVGLTAWLLLLAQMLFSRVRYLRFTSGILGFRLTLPHLLFQLPVIFLDFFAWSRPLVDYVKRGGEDVW